MPYADGPLLRGWKSISSFACGEFSIGEEAILFVVLGQVKEKVEDQAGDTAWPNSGLS